MARLTSTAGIIETSFSTLYGILTQAPIASAGLYPAIRHLLGNFGMAEYQNSYCNCGALGQALGVFISEFLSTQAPNETIFNIVQNTSGI